MYAILNNNNEICDFETRNVQINELVHNSMEHLYVEICYSSDLKIGDIWNPETKEWTIIDIDQVETTYSQESICQHVPTNTEIAQMISDLQADLIIAGVI